MIHAPDEYYNDAYLRRIMVVFKASNAECSLFENLDPSDAFINTDKGKLVLILGAYSDAEYVTRPPSYGIHPSFSEVLHLIEIGYYPSIERFGIEYNREMTSRYFDKDLGRDFKEYDETNNVVVYVNFTKPLKLQGREPDDSRVTSGKKSRLDPKKIRRFLIRKCRQETLNPCQAYSLELTSKGCSKQKISEITHWSESEISGHLKEAYENLNIRSKKDLIDLLDVHTNNGRDDIVFSFEIAGTCYHKKEAKKLLRAKPKDLEARREPDNRHDKNAIAILLRGNMVGYVPKKIAPKIARLLDDGFGCRFTKLEARETQSYYVSREWWTDDYGAERLEINTDALVELACMNPNPIFEKKPHEQAHAEKKKYAIDEGALKSGVNNLKKSHRLTEGEAITITGIAQGKTRAEIAVANNWTLNQAKDRSKNAYRKLQVHTREELCHLIRANARTVKIRLD